MGGASDAKLAGKCPACHFNIPRNLGRKGNFEILSCRNCGTIYTNGKSESPEAQNYDGYYTAANLLVPDIIHKRLDEIVAGFARYRVQNRMLEVGFGAGSLLSAAVRAGWEVEGVEVSRSAVEQGKAQGFKTFCGELAEARYASGGFDLVIATELLEHVPDPGAMILEIGRILRPGGLFWATTPNSRGLSRRILGLDWSVISPPEHLHLLSENGIRTLLEKAGFRSVRIDAEGTNPFELAKWRGWRKSSSRLPIAEDSPAGYGCERVNAGYRMNEVLMKSRSRRAVKSSLNYLLRVSHLGDSLKIWAER
jgi:SAM-dependent methyltransferase